MSAPGPASRLHPMLSCMAASISIIPSSIAALLRSLYSLNLENTDGMRPDQRACASGRGYLKNCVVNTTASLVEVWRARLLREVNFREGFIYFFGS